MPTHNPSVPETLEGWSVLHQMFRLRWDLLRGLSADDRAAIAREAATALTAPGGAGTTAFVQLLGHKGDLMLSHFRPTFEELSAVQLALGRCHLSDLLDPTTSYVSIVELGMYEMTAKIHQQLAAKGLATGTSEFDQAFDEEMARQRSRVASRLFLDAGPEVERTASPAISELLARRARLLADLDELKRKQSFMPADDYARELERLLVDIARLSRDIRQS